MAPLPGILFLLPSPIAPAAEDVSVIPHATRDAVAGLDYFIAEELRTARRYLKRLGVKRPINELEFGVLNEHTPVNELPKLLQPIEAGRSGALLSEAGCPCVADPGALLVRLAQEQGIQVRPLVGPSSILLALMASGLGGQSFAFNGYLPVEKGERRERLRALESESVKRGQTQLFMETPYRNDALMGDLLNVLRPGTLLLVAAGITTSDERIVTKTVEMWRQEPRNVGKVPVIFGLLGQTGSS